MRVLVNPLVQGFFAGGGLLLLVSPSYAQPTPEEIVLDEMSIVGDATERQRIAGSAHLVSEAQLQAFEYDDIHRVLGQVPGVYLRTEEGFGLRPNIGIRGANSDRSAKVTLMEDGVLFGPAPYSAPAAYYFPLLTRMTAVEVFKGPAAIRYGPQTIGGAINLVTRPIPAGFAGSFDGSYGLNDTGKLHGWVGAQSGPLGIMAEVAHIRSDGFKRLDIPGSDGAANTGFDKTEVMLKGAFQTDPTHRTVHRLQLKGGYANESSRETYLGLTDADFRDAPLRRYAASQDDLMEWSRWQGVLSYRLQVGEHFELNAAGYRHTFDRSWRKLNRFAQGPSLENILRDPEAGLNRFYYQVLTGDADSLDNQALVLGTNSRRFVSEGVQTTMNLRDTFFGVQNNLQLGVRWHHDLVERTHTEDPYAMRSGRLEPQGDPTLLALHNQASTTAWALHLIDEVSFAGLLVTPGVRVELIEGRLTDEVTRHTLVNQQVVALPGIGVSYAVTDWLSLLGGVHRGFSPVAPGQPAEVQPETSINTEVGARFNWAPLRGEVIGFFNAYQNLTGECRFSSGCGEGEIDRQFNAGEVHVAGLEALLGVDWQGPDTLRLGGYATYTFTWSEFQNDFRSPFPQFGDVRAGDSLAYVPVHQVAAVVGGSYQGLSLDVSFVYVGEMRDVAGSGPIAPQERIPDQALLDVSAGYRLFENHQLYVNLYNVLDQAYLAARRPFGARPTRPFHLQIGYRVEFGT